ncbi:MULTISPECIES: DegV family protein [Clostridium]|uniref:DegV family protein n=1 Tax=Clostridium TaxID=1485 RepID=UPI00069DB55D|nr:MULTISPECIES: DegV family protein [Clostridium]KOF57339.1 DegV domain-containing protein [Clostridium sp. DMHC 10]MCD2346543.1 DegV family protein [Clostridium guangxiense]
MEKIKIITDSTADLPQYIVDKYDIEVLPLIVNIKGKMYLDIEEIKLPQLLKVMDEENIFPTTSQVNPQRFYDCFKNYLDKGYKIISIIMSSKMSGTYQSACIAKDMLESNDIAVIDSLNVTSGLGLLVIKACKLKEQGMNFKDIEAKIIETIPHVKSALAFESLDNLVKGGRLSKTAGTIGNILGIKLILEVKDGEMSVMDKVRGSKKAVKVILDYLNEKGIIRNETSILLHVGDTEILPALRERLKEEENDFIECEVGCVVGTHSGSGACGVFFIENY